MPDEATRAVLAPVRDCRVGDVEAKMGVGMLAQEPDPRRSRQNLHPQAVGGVVEFVVVNDGGVRVPYAKSQPETRRGKQEEDEGDGTRGSQVANLSAAGPGGGRGNARAPGGAAAGKREAAAARRPCFALPGIPNRSRTTGVWYSRTRWPCVPGRAV